MEYRETYTWNPEYDPMRYGVVRYRLGQYIDGLPSPLREIFISIANDGKLACIREKDTANELVEDYLEGKISKNSFLRRTKKLVQSIVFGHLAQLSREVKPHYNSADPQIINTTAFT